MRNIDEDNAILAGYGLPVIDDDTAQAGFSLCGHWWPPAREYDITQVKRVAPVVIQDDKRRQRVEYYRQLVENNSELFAE